MNVLLLEDDEALAIGIEFTLRKEGFNVKKAYTVKDAIEVIDNESIDLALLDISLPDGTGYSVCEHIRDKSDMPIIFLTALDEEVNVILGLEMGGDDYITKPFGVRELIARIKVILRRINKNSTSSDILKSGDLELDTKDIKVRKNNEEVLLTAQEYRLVSIFMNNPGIVLERDLILDKLLDGMSDFIDSNTLSVYIRRIREKIEDDIRSPEYITTIRGIGYKWNKKVYKG
ncbi:DNA-binding response regulator, OmpR family, contains REC and winged-helix (wHTH) domain [Clostridium cavendishii DSM 21758]|uniref:Stage 0 sporulation protein A homolog n=1 Tax=Clostridium cavendishii DSM 21758 TaxID=1121302 RepID=A0A1M6TF42_9CLOT|nr:response regulator transcription factor [Clostridium cavendishii]SHK55456.1 DNA-binding response regulator, OmpR family, contains REC and winged-helix (wHTH) domain [Clostridium cavendishii DSM 21758]